jgi:hypothetical protein
MEPIQKSLKDMQSIDVRTVDAGTLRDIQNVSVNRDFPKEERIQSYLQQIGNPYCFRYGKYVVKLSFSDSGKTLEDCLLAYLRSKC